jgi:hypothetical protein
MDQKHDHMVRAFLVSSDYRDKKYFPNPSEFDYELPITLTDIEGISIRDYKFRKETIINNNNNQLQVYGDNGTINYTFVLNTGDYSNDITQLITYLNNTINQSGNILTFGLDATRNYITVTLIGTALVSSYVIIRASPILACLGLSKDGICLYRTTKPAGQDPRLTYYLIGTTSTIPYDVWNTSNMVIRIKDVEAISAPNSVADRATAVLFSCGDTSTTIKQCLDHYIPLLQPQSRLQKLRIKLLNMNGDLYDTLHSEVVFLIRFHCKNPPTLR